jgi:WD40 repeat protein
MDIQRYLQDEPVVACPPSAAYRFHKFARRNKTAITTAVLIAAALVTGTALSTWQAIRATRAAAAEVRASEHAREAELDAKQQLFAAALARANASRASGRQGQRLDALTAIEQATSLLRPLGLAEEARLALRNEAIGSQELVDLRPVRKWQARQSVAEGYSAFSADFELLAFSHDEWIHVRRMDAPTTDVARIPVTKGTSAYFLSFDPTKQYLARLRPLECTVYVAEIASAKDILVVPDTIQFAAADFHPRSPHLAVGDRHGVVHCFDLVSGREIRKWSIGRPILSLKYDRQGSRLAVGSAEIKDAEVENEEIDVCDAETGQVLIKVSEPGVSYPRDWSPDGKWLAVGAVPDVHLFEVDRAEGRHLVLQGHRSQVTNLQFHPQGRILASTSWDGTTRLWDAATGQHLLRSEGNFSVFSADGRLMASLQGLDISLLEVLNPCAHRWLSCGKTYAVGVAPGDRLMATCHNDGVRLWDLDHLEQVAFLSIGVTRGVAFRPPAGQLVTSGKAGLYQWPITTEIEGDVERVHLGPPQAIDASLKNMRSAHFSRDGSVLLTEAFFRDEAYLLHLAESAPRRLRLTRPNLSLTALSPDGKWAAVSDSLGTGTVGIWNARTGEHVCDLPTPSGSQICFSPDGRSMITNCGLEMQIWDVGTWRPRFKASFRSDSASAVAITPDSRLAAVGVWGVGAMLMEVDTGRRVAMLDLPEKPPVYVGLSFTSDGSRLLAAVDHMGCCVWDIRALRERLATLGLDWDQPPLTESPKAAPNPLRVEFDLGTLARVKDEPTDAASPAVHGDPESAARGESAAPAEQGDRACPRAG